MKVAHDKLLIKLEKFWNKDLVIRILCISAVVVFFGGVAAQFIHLVRQEILYFQFPLKGDENLYLAEGRAWLNGFTFYRDLFETKPPLVFLIAALSLFLTDTNSLLLWMQLLCLVSSILLLSVCTFRQTSHMEESTRAIIISVSSLLGLIFVVDTLDRTLGYQPEGFALIFAIIPAFCLISKHRFAVVVAGASLGIAAMLKEPFAVSAFLAMLVFCRSWDDVYRLVKILVFGGLTALLILLLSGSLTSYFSIYLPEMLHGRSINSVTYPNYSIGVKYIIPVPLWMRGFNAYRLISDLGFPPTRVFLSVFLFVCLAIYPPLQANDFRLRSILTSFGVLVTGFFSGHQFYVFLELFNGMHQLGQPFPWFSSISIRLLLLCIIPPSSVLLMSRFLRTERTWFFSLLTFLGMVLCGSLVAFNGDFDYQYFVFAFPPLIAISVVCLVQIAKQEKYILLSCLALLLVLHAIMPNQYRYVEYDEGPPGKSTEDVKTAHSLDSVLTECRQQRYFYAGTESTFLFALTKHSPYQIEYGLQRALGGFNSASVQEPNANLAAKLNHDLATTQVIVASESGTIPPTIAQAISDRFTDQSDCAMPIPGLRVFFRKTPLAD